MSATSEGLHLRHTPTRTGGTADPARTIANSLRRRWMLLEPHEIQRPGDELWNGWQWQPLPALHHGDPVGEDSSPVRRRAL